MPSGTARVAQRAQQALTDSAIRALRDLHVTEDGSSLVLSGRVTSFYQKQLAQEAVRSVCRDIDLVNSVDVTGAAPQT
jgi:hypothetical protein